MQLSKLSAHARLISVLALGVLLPALSGCTHRMQRPVGDVATAPAPAEAPSQDNAGALPAADPSAADATSDDDLVDGSVPDPSIVTPDPETPDADEEVTESPLDDLAQVTPELDTPTLIAERELVEATEPEFDIPMVTNDKVLFWINYYTERRKQDFLPGLERSGRYVPMFRRIFREAGLPQDLVYMAHVESAYKTSAYSRAKAMGVWQFMSYTGRRYGLKIDYWVDERRDPEKAAHAAAAYLKKLYGDFGDWYLAMAAYNGGEGRIGRALSRSGEEDFWGIANTNHIRRETKNYVPAILAAIQISKDPEKFGMQFQPDDPVEYETVQIEGAVDLQVLADCSGSDFDALRTMNPALRRQQTPPNATTEVRVPRGTAERTLVALADVPQERRVLYVRHRVRSGDTLSGLASAYGVSVSAIQQANSMGRRTLINAGKELVIPTVAAGKFSSSRVAAGPPPAQRSSGENIAYRVRRGDTLSGIARRYDTTPRAIAAASGISVNRVLQIGQRLIILSGVRSERDAAQLTNAVAKAGEHRTYTVRRGDTLWRIASMFRTSVDHLCSLNGISRQGTLYPGTLLNIGP